METIYKALTYIFQPLPVASFKYYIPLTILCAVLLTGAVYLKILVRRKKDDKTFRRAFRGFPSKLITVAIILAIYLASRYYNIAFISARIILIITLGVICYFLYRMIRVYFRDYPLQKRQHKQQMEKNKYIPGKKKK
jgi:amino acid transporter